LTSSVIFAVIDEHGYPNLCVGLLKSTDLSLYIGWEFDVTDKEKY